MKFKDLREEAPTNSAGTGGFSGSAAAGGPVAGYDPSMKLKKNNTISNKKIDYSTFRDSNNIKEWYTDNYQIQYTDEDGKPGVIEVRANTPTKFLKNKKIKSNNFGYKILDGEDSDKKQAIKQPTDTDFLYKKKQNFYKKIDEEFIFESGGKAIDKIQDAAKNKEKTILRHDDGTKTSLDSITAGKIDKVYKSLDASNKVKFIKLANSSNSTFTQLLSFVNKNFTKA